ncbi:MAG: GYF domain-containing protein [Opitutales bacterium]
MHIYVSKEGQQYGPYTVEQLGVYLQQGNFTMADYACFDGQNWVAIAQVPGFSVENQAVATQPQTQQTPPEPAEATQAQVQVEEASAVQSQPATEQEAPVDALGAFRKKKIRWTSIGAAVALLVAGIVIWLLVGGVGAGMAASDLDDPEVLGDVLEEAIEVNQVAAQQAPYTGWAKKMHDNGKVDNLTFHMEGKPDGPSVTWYPGGQKFMEAHFTDGKQDGSWTLWHENGRKKGEGQYKAGGPDGTSIHWYSSGEKMGEHHHEDGKLMSATVWKPNGVKCFLTNVRKGNGVLVTYHESGTEWFRSNYENGVNFRE